MNAFSAYNEDLAFENIDLRDEPFYGLEFCNCTFNKCNFSGATFEKCQLEDCVFTDCNLSLIKPKQSSFVDVDFKSCKAIGINWADAATPVRINFRACSIDSSSFFDLNLSMIVMSDCRAREVDFSEANLSKGTFTATDFLNSRFANTNLTQSDFRNATHYNINPNSNRLKKTKFSTTEALSLLSVFDIELD
jgi:uncharacterized protein YjbI with pentapeptide repeats